MGRAQLTPDETGAIGKLSSEQAQALHRLCDGWVAGLVLLLANRDAAKFHEATRAQNSKESLFGYFASEVFARTTPETRDLLMRTALFPYFTLPMAIEISGTEGAAHILSALYEKQYFIERKVDGELTYQYHDLFREFLLTRLSETHDVAALALLRVSAGDTQKR